MPKHIIDVNQHLWLIIKQAAALKKMTVNGYINQILLARAVEDKKDLQELLDRVTKNGISGE